jgi:hypothetical protein
MFERADSRVIILESRILELQAAMACATSLCLAREKCRAVAMQ